MTYTITRKNGDAIEFYNLPEILAGRELGDLIQSNERFEVTDIYGVKYRGYWSSVEHLNLNA